MSRMRDTKGRFVAESNSKASTVAFAIVVCAVVGWFYYVRQNESFRLPQPPPQVVTVPADPIDWEKVKVRSIPDKEWQDAHDKSLLRQIEIRLQRVIDRNEARETPAFSKH